MPDAETSRGSDGRKRRWEQHNADRRAHIVSAALTLLARDIGPGDHMTAQRIAAEAGVHRTGLYRYFQDRTDLDLTIQRAVCGDLLTTLSGSFGLEGTPREVVHRVVGTYVRWVAEHPEWARFIERDVSAAPSSPLEETNLLLARQLEDVVAGFLSLVQAELTADDRSLVGPWVAALVFGSMGAVRSWNSQGERRAGLNEFSTFLADTIWLQVKGLGASRGIHIPQTPLEELLDRPQ